MEDTFVSLLQAQPAITALIGSGVNARLFPVILPQDPIFPCLSYQIISGPRDYTQDGADGVVRFRVQCNLYGSTYAQVKALRDALESSVSGLHNQSFGSPSVKVKGVFITNERDTFEQALSQLPPGAPYRKSVDLMITLEHPA